MKTPKSLSVIVAIMTINWNSLKVESGNLVGRDSESDPSTGPSLDISLPGMDDEPCVPVPLSIFQKMRNGEPLSDLDRVKLCFILSGLAATPTHALKRAQFHVRPATEQFESDAVHREILALRNAEFLHVGRIYCPPEEGAENSAQPQSTADVQGQNPSSNEGSYVQLDETGDGIKILDKNGEHVRTINANEFCQATETESKTED